MSLTAGTAVDGDPLPIEHGRPIETGILHAGFGIHDDANAGGDKAMGVATEKQRHRQAVDIDFCTFTNDLRSGAACANDSRQRLVTRRTNKIAPRTWLCHLGWRSPYRQRMPVRITHDTADRGKVRAADGLEPDGLATLFSLPQQRAEFVLRINGLADPQQLVCRIEQVNKVAEVHRCPVVTRVLPVAW